MAAANVRSIQALTDLKSALARYGADAQSTRQRLEQELHQTQEWLAERQRHWQWGSAPPSGSRAPGPDGISALHRICPL